MTVLAELERNGSGMHTIQILSLMNIRHGFLLDSQNATKSGLLSLGLGMMDKERSKSKHRWVVAFPIVPLLRAQYNHAMLVFMVRSL